jgi:hypothetical protein
MKERRFLLMSQANTLCAALEAVNDPKSFLAFVRELTADREDEVKKERVQPSSPYSPGVNGWENGTIEAFLEAAVAWADDTDFCECNVLSAGNLWYKFARFLHAGKTYE